MTQTNPPHSSLPLILAGPILRKTTASEINLWLVSSEPVEGTFQVFDESGEKLLYQAPLSLSQQQQVGEHAFVALWHFAGEYPTNCALFYQIDTQVGAITELFPHLCYEGDETKGIAFSVRTTADYILHGSCRNPHHRSADALVAADKKVALLSPAERPDLLLLSGDQIYADHVAGPTLDAITQLIERLGLANETFVDAPFQDSLALYEDPRCFYARDQILPDYVDQSTLFARLTRFRRQPVFSSTESENHLISFAEFFAMYLLVWSPQAWQLVNRERLKEQAFEWAGQTLSEKWQQLWHKEIKQIDDFVAGLPSVQRLLAHLPTYMIFDDHDVTDDWNLTIGWETAAYQHPFSRRVIGNGLLSYWLCQGWGNAPEKFDERFFIAAQRYFHSPTAEHQDAFIQLLYRFEDWHYTIPTEPKVVVLDTRTRRWRSESRMNKPSGLMDWEALVELQQELMHQEKVIIVSAAPMFGVKFIEMLQRIMTQLGQPLLIDAENWMAHPGSANTLISIFTHTKTPTNFVILSGDVHYSFVYDIKLRFRKSSPNIYQITCSGLKNHFPARLLRFCDAMDRLLYSPRSPLNWFTKRKRLKIKKRSPDNQRFYRLVNHSAIGELYLDADGKPKRVSLLTSDGRCVDFPATSAEE